MQRNNAIQPAACASCKHQRKKCTEKCVLVSVFPADKMREFQAVHKVFGVSNVTKMLKNLKDDDKKKVVDSLVWEALCRQKDPVLGPYGEYRKLFDELKLYKSQFYPMATTTNQGVMVHKPSPNFGWNGNSNGVCNKSMSTVTNNSKTLSYFHNNRGFVVDQSQYEYSSNQPMIGAEGLVQEREIILPQDHPVGAQYYLTTGDQFNPMNT